jgi:uncharacterized membrane protein
VFAVGYYFSYREDPFHIFASLDGLQYPTQFLDLLGSPKIFLLVYPTFFQIHRASALIWGGAGIFLFINSLIFCDKKSAFGRIHRFLGWIYIIAMSVCTLSGLCMLPAMKLFDFYVTGTSVFVTALYNFYFINRLVKSLDIKNKTTRDNHRTVSIRSSLGVWGAFWQPIVYSCLLLLTWHKIDAWRTSLILGGLMGLFLCEASVFMLQKRSDRLGALNKELSGF